MTSTRNPRLIPLAMVVLGAAAVGAFIAIDGMNLIGRGGTKAAFLIGIGSVAFGIGLAQLIWPPPPLPADVPSSGFLIDGFSRASWPQRILYLFGAMIGAVAAAVLTTMATGSI